MSTTLSRRMFLAAWTGTLAAFAAACQSQAVPVPAAPTSGAAAKPAAATPGQAATAAPVPTSAPAPASAPTSAPAATAAPAVVTTAGGLPPVARNETLIMTVSDTFTQFQDAPLANPFLRAIQRNGWHFMYEPLFFWNPYWTRDVKWPVGLPGNEARVPWLAESAAYSADSSQLMVKLRSGVTWSDGQPFTARDIVFTLNMLKDNSPDLLFAFDMK